MFSICSEISFNGQQLEKKKTLSVKEKCQIGEA